MECTWDLAPRAHTERTVPTIDWMLEAVGWTHSDLDGIGVTTGPGSFTGLRVGLSVAQGLATALGIPAVGVSTLAALAFNLAHAEGTVVPVLDARKGEVYTAQFSASAGSMSRSAPDALKSPAEITDEIARAQERFFFIGDALGPYGDQWRTVMPNRAVFVQGSQGLPRAGNVGMLAARALQAQDEPPELQPTYLRRPEAVVSAEAKKKP
jgi:tRNA threonylcarbamoyladenosine biosynthesis protein TsaB